MKRPLQSVVAQVPVLLLGAWPPRSAQGQGFLAPGPAGPALIPPDGGSLIAPAIVLGLALVAALALGAVCLDLQRRRRALAIEIEAWISDALMREPRLARAMIEIVAHGPQVGRLGRVVEMRGEVEHPDLREIAVRIAR